MEEDLAEVESWFEPEKTDEATEEQPEEQNIYGNQSRTVEVHFYCNPKHIKEG